MGFSNKKVKVKSTVTEVKREKVKGGRGKKKYREVPVREQLEIETNSGRKYSETYLSGDAKLIQDMIEELYQARTKTQFKNIQQQFRMKHPDLTDRMLKDPVVMFAIPKWEDKESVGDWMQDFMQAGQTGERVRGTSSERLMTSHEYERGREAKRLKEQRHKAPDIGSSRLWDTSKKPLG